MAELSEQHPALKVKLIDTRGARHIAVAPLYFTVAMGQLLGLALGNRISVIHANMASHGSAVRKFVAVALATAVRVPVVLHLHAAVFDKFYSESPGAWQACIRWMFRRASRIVVLGLNAKRMVVERFGVPSERVEVISNGVRRPASLARAPSRPAACPVILFLGRLGRRKGVDTLITALAAPSVARHQWKAVLAGDSDPAPYQALARDLGIADRVSFPGWLDEAGVRTLLAQASVFVLPSHAEGLPMAVLEALAFGIPVIATPVGALPDSLVDDQSVLFVEPGDSGALASALDRVLSDGSLRARIGQAGHEVFQREFDIVSIGERFAAIYRLLGGSFDQPDSALRGDERVVGHGA